MNVRLATLVVLAGANAAALVGCDQEPHIKRYQVPKQHLLDKLNGGEAGRMLAAIVPHEKENWFFKLVGPTTAVEKQAKAFDSFIKSVRFAGPEEPPDWTLPEGWTQRPSDEKRTGDQMRFATLEINAKPAAGDTAQPAARNTAQSLEVSVTTLPRPEDDDGAFALANINRWRGQLDLAPIDREQMARETTELELADAKAIVVDFEGKLKPGGPPVSGRPPFAGGAMTGPPSGRPAGAGGLGRPNGQGGQNDAGELTYEVPEGWEETGPGPMRKAGFRATDGGLKAEITISTAGGALLANVNRWRGQVELEPIDEEQLKDAALRITVGEAPGAYFRLVGPDKTILGVVTEAAGQIWFIKLTGENELAQRERERFEAFVQSIQFSGKEGADDGE